MEQNYAALLRDDITTVEVQFFRNAPTRQEVEDSLELGATGTGKLYTYVALKSFNLAPDDLVTVFANGIPVVVKVVGVHDRCMVEPNSTFRYKWVVSKVDIDGYIEMMEANKEIESIVQEAQRENIRKGFRNLLMGTLDETQQARLLSVMSKKEGEQNV